MQKLITKLENLQASEEHEIDLYTREYIEELKGCSNSMSLLMKCFSFLPWYDHTVIRELASSCECHHGMQLLDEYVCHVDLLQPISSYSTPHVFSFPKIPDACTMMAIRYKEQFSSLTLHDIYKIKMEVVQICDLTKYAFTLMGVIDYGSDVFYGFVPNAAVSLINSRVSQRSRDLCEMGVLEVATYPGFSIHTRNVYEVSSRSHFAFIENVSLTEINKFLSEYVVAT